MAYQRARRLRRKRLRPYNRLQGFFTDTGAESELLDATQTPPDRYRYAIVNPNIATATLASIRAQHPGAGIYAYMNFGGMRVGPHATVDGQSRPTSLVTYEDANGGGHEDWFLHKEAGGARIQFSDFPDLYAANVANAGWRTAASQYFQRLKDAGYQGAFLDDYNMWPGHGFSEGEANDSTEFSSDNDYRDAVVAAGGVVKTAADAIGFRVIANVAGDPWNVDHRAGFTQIQTGPKLHAWVREAYHSWSGGISSAPFGGSSFSSLQEMVAEATTATMGTLGNTPPLNPIDHFRMLRFGRAAYDLEWDGVADGGYGYNSGKPTSIYGQYRQLLGRPLGAKQLVAGTSSDGAWMRTWTWGVVCVNARSTGATAFTLGGVYLNEDGDPVTSVNLDPGYGSTLLRPF